MRKLPKSLDSEPLVDAVFEVRMGGSPHMADILPGALFGQLTPKPTFQRLPAAEIPQPIRESDINLMFAPVIRLDWREFTISMGDKNLVIGCKLPYPKWPRFKEVILDVTRRVSEIGITGTVDRYSVKYVNLIPAPTIAEQINKIDMSVRLGDVAVSDDHVSIQVHRKEGDTLHLMSIVTGAQGQMADGKNIFGAIVDIDSIRTIQFRDFRAFVANLEDSVESLRQSNKAKFFSCITEEAEQEMGPKYD